MVCPSGRALGDAPSRFPSRPSAGGDPFAKKEAQELTTKVIIDFGRISPDTIGAPFEPKPASLFIEGKEVFAAQDQFAGIPTRLLKLWCR